MKSSKQFTSSYKIVRPWARVRSGGLICELESRLFALVTPENTEALVLGVPAYLTGQGQSLEYDFTDTFTQEELDLCAKIIAQTPRVENNPVPISFYQKVCEAAGKIPVTAD